MAIATTASTVVLLLFAGLWSGSSMFVVLVFFPLAEAGDINAEPLPTLTERFQWIPLVSAFVLVATGGHLDFALYDPATLHTARRPAYRSTGRALARTGGSRRGGRAKLTDGSDRSKV